MATGLTVVINWDRNGDYAGADLGRGLVDASP